MVVGKINIHPLHAFSLSGNGLIFIPTALTYHKESSTVSTHFSVNRGSVNSGVPKQDVLVASLLFIMLELLMTSDLYGGHGMATAGNVLLPLIRGA